MALVSALRERHTGRALLPLGLAFFAVSISTALVYPFMSLFLSTAVHAGPVKVTVFLIVAPLAGVVASSLVGRLSDRWAIRRTLLIGAAVAGVIGSGLTAFVRDYWLLLALASTATAFAAALFPQTFAYARQVLARDSPHRAALGISTLRTILSLAWVAGPSVAAVLLAAGGFQSIYGAAACAYAIAALIAIFWLDEVGTAAPDTGPADTPVARDRPEAPRWMLLATTAAFTLLQCPLTLSVQALPLFIRDDLSGRPGDAGLILGLCALLEIPLMLGFGVLSTRIRLRTLVLAGAACGVAYEVLAMSASGVGVLAAAQVVNALFIASVSGLGITYMQDMLPRQPGRATTLFTNSFPIGAVLAGPLFGLSQHLGYRFAYGFGAAFCAVGLVVLLLVRPPDIR